LLDETVARTLRQVLGDAPATALIYHVGVSASVSGAEKFSDALRRIVGSGSVVVEKLIVKELYSQIGMGSEGGQQGFSFGSSLLRAQEFVERRG
jgi:hypothetical protein